MEEEKDKDRSWRKRDEDNESGMKEEVKVEKCGGRKRQRVEKR